MTLAGTVMPADEPIRAGEVWLVGAGPGDPDLLTRKAERLIGAADVVFHDALVGPGVLALAPAGTQTVAVGKRCGRHSTRQGAICQLLLKASRDGRRVVRLKGGDPSIFGRSLEEAAYLRAHGVSVRICPGITAASAAVASAGRSLTARGIASRVQFLSARLSGSGDVDLDWPAIAASRSTLAVYMGHSVAGQLACKLLQTGAPPDFPVLVAADASLPTERLISTRLALLGHAVASVPSDSAVVLIIGDVVDAPADGLRGDRPGARTSLIHRAGAGWAAENVERVAATE